MPTKIVLLQKTADHFLHCTYSNAHCTTNQLVCLYSNNIFLLVSNSSWVYQNTPKATSTFANKQFNIQRSDLCLVFLYFCCEFKLYIILGNDSVQQGCRCQSSEATTSLISNWLSLLYLVLDLFFLFATLEWSLISIHAWLNSNARFKS